MNNDLSSYFEEPEFKELLAKYESMAESHAPTYFDAEELTDIAEYYASLNREEESEAAVDMALRLHPGNTDALVFKARSLAIRGKIKEAYQIAALIEDPSDREVKFLKADLLLEEQRTAEADAVYKELAETENYSTNILIDITLAYLDTNQKEYASKWLNVLRDRGVNEENSRRFRDLWCDFCITFNEPKKAIKAYQLTLDESPYSIPHWNGLARCYLQLDNLPLAHESVDFALAIDEHNKEALEVKGFCHLQGEEYEAAIHIYLRLMESETDRSRLFTPLVKCYIETEQISKALETCRLWLKECKQITDYERSEIYCYIAMCYCDLANPMEGIKYIDASLDLNPFSRPALIQKGMLHLQLFEDDRAEKAFEKARLLTPKEEMSDTLYAILDCYFCLSRYEQAIEQCETIIKKYPDNRREAYMITANAYYQLNDISKCLDYLSLLWQETQTFDEPTWKDSRFAEMLYNIQRIMREPGFDPDKYL